MVSHRAPDSPLSALDRLGARRVLLPALGLLLYGVFLAHYMGAYAGGSDSSGYLNNARLLSEGRITAPMRLVPGLTPASLPGYTYVPLGFIPNPDHATLTPTYPMGLSLLMLAAAQVVGWSLAPGVVVGLHALLGVWLVYRLGREVGLDRGLAWLGALALAASPLYVLLSLQTLSDVPALVWVTGAVWLALRSRNHPGRAAAAGAALAVAVLLRPTDLLAFVPVFLALGAPSRRWLWCGLGGLPGAVALGALNLAAYHRVFTTGYGDIGGIVGARFVPETLVHYLVWLPVVLPPFVYLAAGVPLLARRLGAVAAVLTAWIAVFLGFYLFYMHTHEEWWYLRFLTPALPPLLVGALLVARALAERLRLELPPRVLAVGSLLVLLYGIGWSRHFDVQHTGRSEAVYPRTATWVRSHLPPAAVVVAMQVSGALYYYTDVTVVRWDPLAPDDFRRIAAACRAAGRPICAVLFPEEVSDLDAFRQHLPGAWTRIGSVRQVSIWRYDAPDAK